MSTKPKKPLPRKGTKARAKLDLQRRAAQMAREARMVPDSELTPEQLRKRQENRRYRAQRKERDATGAAPMSNQESGKLGGLAKARKPVKRRDHNKKVNGGVLALLAQASGGSQEHLSPLEVIPGSQRAFAHAGGLPGPSGRVGMLLALELVRTVNRLIELEA